MTHIYNTLWLGVLIVAACGVARLLDWLYWRAAWMTITRRCGRPRLRNAPANDTNGRSPATTGTYGDATNDMEYIHGKVC